MNPETVKNRIKGTENRQRTYLGTRTSILDVEEDVTLRDTDRLTHVLTTGPTGYGKSQELVHVALQDAHKGYGCCIINPKGDLIDEFIAKLPEERWDDIIYINPAHPTVPSINVLEPYTNGRMTLAQQENQKEIIVSDLIDLFRRHSENWGDQFGRVLETLLHAYLELNIKNSDSHTLVDVYRSVINQNALTDLIDQVRDPVVREQLARVKEDMTSYEMEPLQRRLNDFMMNSAIRRVINANGTGINFQEAVDSQKLILVDVQKGEVGATVSELVGSIITKIWAAVQSRVTQPIDERTPFYLFVDEVQNYSGEGSNFAKILSEAREYRLGCWLATQYLHQLERKMQKAVVNNINTKIAFNPGSSEDLTRIAGMLQGIDKDDLAELGRFRAAIQTPDNGNRDNARIIDTYPPWDANRGHVADIKHRSGTSATQGTSLSPSLGPGTNSGGEKHRELLTTAKQRLEERGLRVDLLYQDVGTEKPDGHVHLPTGDVVNLEAEHTTLSKPAKVLENLERAAEDGRECIFVVEEGNADTLRNIVEDPVNRSGDRYRDQHGSYDFYTEDGEPYTRIEKLEDANYRTLEVQARETETGHEELREKDRRVLECIREGKDDVQKITEATCLENHEVNYCFRKLKDLDLVEIEKPEGKVERVIDGQKRVFQAPKKASLTELGYRSLV
ncbi:type IV secretory system conjugative DNA transfer family protein [Natronobacterium texcoconense]|uniref:AAA-like domain-containing protein n=1 Tax=Natronobacterium texcoconense TaxID=1095778 RepID=A0A1H1AMB1_NATTX|nr:TraM recognition domain-containing protein [Natronobacterium texcoconense]SDQ40752.1 AAA-like domain-containing protein [Natronobacterium texcoconense]